MVATVRTGNSLPRSTLGLCMLRGRTVPGQGLTRPPATDGASLASGSGAALLANVGGSR